MENFVETFQMMYLLVNYHLESLFQFHLSASTTIDNYSSSRYRVVVDSRRSRKVKLKRGAKGLLLLGQL